MRRGICEVLSLDLDPLMSCLHHAGMFESTTNNVLVKVHPIYVKEQSQPERDYYFFAYQVTIHNQSEAPLQLMSRHWIITDGDGRTEEVEGEGVIGEQPLIAPGGKYQYTSFCPLPTPTGSMQGAYFLKKPDSEMLRVEIPQFILCEPSRYH